MSPGVGERAPVRSHRLFVAVRPPAEVRELLAALPRPEAPALRWVPPEQWHVTLRFLGPADPAEVTEAVAGAVLPAATATLGPAVGRLGRSVVVVPVAGLDALAAAVRRATATLGDPPDPRGFSGHLTLARRADRASASGVVGTAISATFEVQEVELVSSRLDAQGATHQVLGRFRVAAR